MVPKWHNLSPLETAKILESNLKKGLSEEGVQKRRKQFGMNLLPEEKSAPGFKILLKQFASPLIYILVIAGVLVLFFKHYTDSIVIFGAVILNAMVGYFQENKASKTLTALRKTVQHRAKTLRGGTTKLINASGLVPGDIFILEPGDKVPADGRIFESHNLKINEMVLTGEWLPAEKKEDRLEPQISLADRDNMVYMGTVVEEGKGAVMVTETGSSTEIGQIAMLIKKTGEERTPYQKKLSHFSKIIGGIIVVICIGLFVEGLVVGREFIEMFTTAVAVAVAAIPEGLPIGMTAILALGMQRILKKKGLVRRLVAAETLGNTTVICTDKTATLTQGKIKVTKVLPASNNDLVYKIAALCNEAFIEKIDDSKDIGVLRGRPTDRALLIFGTLNGFSKMQLEKELPMIDIMSFSSQRKFLATLHRNKKDNSNILFVAGAPEKIFEMSKLSSKEEQKWEKELTDLAVQGLRTVAFAAKKTLKTKIDQTDLEGLNFVALLGLSDPLRPDAKESIRICKKAGMRVIIVTGDHKLTAKTIAQELGFKLSKNSIMEGQELDGLSDEEFQERLKEIQIYARVESKHKMRIIKAWQDRGEVVAMTGDGINDAPALKKADIGVSLGSGTEAAQETSDLILLNDSFSVIVAAVQEGRAILDNIRKMITYLLSDSFTEVILVGVSILAGFPLPVSAVQILWINLIEDGLPNIALAFEPKEKDLMRQKPAGHKAPFLTREMKAIIFIIGLVTDLILLGIFFCLLNQNYDIFYLRTIIFAMLGIDSISYVFCCKSLRKNLWHINLFDNKFLLVAWMFGMLALVGAIYLPVLNVLLKTVPLNLSNWGLILGLGLVNVILIELTKWYFIVRHQTEN